MFTIFIYIAGICAIPKACAEAWHKGKRGEAIGVIVFGLAWIVGGIALFKVMNYDQNY